MRIDRLLSPDAWVFGASLLAGAGLVCVGAGILTGRLGLWRLGAWLCAPLILGGVVLVTVVIPVLIVANRKHRQK